MARRTMIDPDTIAFCEAAGWAHLYRLLRDAYQTAQLVGERPAAAGVRLGGAS
jgi:hypothetical protein